MRKLVAALLALAPTCALAQSQGTVALCGPSTGCAEISRAAAVNSAVNNALAAKADAANPVISGTATVGGATGMGTVTIAPLSTTAGVPSATQINNVLNTSFSGGTGIGFLDSNSISITGAPNISWWTGIDYLAFSGTGGTGGHVARTAQTTRWGHGAGGASNNPQLWAMVAENDDFTGTTSATTNAAISIEMDLTGHNVDNGNNRIMATGVIGPAHDGPNAYEAEIGYSLNVNPGGTVKKAVYIAGNYITAILDFRNAFSFAPGATSLDAGAIPTVTAPVTASVTVPVSNAMPFTSDIYGRDLNIGAGAYQLPVTFSDGKTGQAIGYTVTGTGATPAGTITLSAPISEASGNLVYNSSNAIWLATGQTIALDTGGQTKISSNGATINLSAPASVSGSLAVAGGVTAAAVQSFGPISLGYYTVSTLPACTTGATKFSLLVVQDATAPTYNGALVGGGTVPVPVFCNGVAWLSH